MPTLTRRMTDAGRAAIGCAAAVTASTVVVAVVYVMGRGTHPVVAAVSGFLAGVISNAMNGRWSWGIRTRPTVLAHVIIGLGALIASCAATSTMNGWVRANVAPHHAIRLALVVGAFVVVQAAFFVAKYAVLGRDLVTAPGPGT
jgi:hypothetical protein